MSGFLKRFVRALLPLSLRTTLAAWFGRNRWFPGANRWAEGLIRELETVDPKTFHKLKWEHHHASYGSTYEPELLFGSGKLNGTTRAYDAFLKELRPALETAGLEGRPIRVLDVGCSVGHVLRALETEVFTEPGSSLTGIDIDRHAISAGQAYLDETDSSIRLHQGDLERLVQVVPDDRYDFTYAAGSLSYLNTDDAERAVAMMLDRTDRLVALVGLSNPDGPNRELDGSRFRDDFGSMWTHNFERMVQARGWTVVRSHWDAPTDDDPQGLYFILAVNDGAPRPGGTSGSAASSSPEGTPTPTSTTDA